MEKCIQIGLFGLGTVGKDLVNLLSNIQNPITENTGVPVKISKVVVANHKKNRGIDTSNFQIGTNPKLILDDNELDVVVELTGDKTFADSMITFCLNKGTPVVTANKALLAEKLRCLMQIARTTKTPFGFEASVGSGVPFLRFLRDGLSAERISEITGVLNSSTNLILDLMKEHKYDYSQALEVAKRKGYTESDPRLDVNGDDTAHKLCIVSGLSFNQEIPLDLLPIQGISGLSYRDLEVAEESGFGVKLIGHARINTSNLSAWVGPAFVPASHPLAAVSGIDNGLVITGRYTGRSFVQGKGAGSYNAALGVINDIIQIIQSRIQETGNFRYESRNPESSQKKTCFHPGGDNIEYVVRLENMVLIDEKTFLKKIFHEHHVNIAGLLNDFQKEASSGKTVYLKTEPCTWQQICSALNQLQFKTDNRIRVKVFRAL
ncbi:homoserine dehydrogenase [bacterium]|nr:homoserine dehydrogenase [bacterium]